MSLWTAGPWRIGKHGGSVVSDTAVAHGPGGCDCVEYYGGHLIAESISSANAKLIAAAPDMVELLAELVDIEGPLPGNAQWAEKVKAMLARVAT